MNLFGKTDEATIGVLVDIGSASVLVAIVASKEKATCPDIIWSHREYSVGRDLPLDDKRVKTVLTALLNASLQLDTVGRKVLQQALPEAGAPTEVQVTVASPWAHTVTKTVLYNKDEPFKISPEVLSELEAAAQKKIEVELESNAVVKELDLKVLTKGTTDMLANGYSIQSAEGQTVSSVALSRTNSLVPGTIQDAIRDVEEKMFVTVDTKAYSFILAYFYVTKALYPDLLEYCLVHITFETAEIGIVRDGVLRYCSHIPQGSYTLAREIAALRKVPVEEAYASMSNGLVMDSTMTSAQSSALEALLIQFETKVAALFLETGDSLSIPKTILLHSTLTSEDFFATRFHRAVSLVTNSTHTVIGISNEIIKRYHPPEIKAQLAARHDTAILVSAQFFHTARERGEFEW